jgi:hypothetical protein
MVRGFLGADPRSIHGRLYMFSMTIGILIILQPPSFLQPPPSVSMSDFDVVDVCGELAGWVEKSDARRC